MQIQPFVYKQFYSCIKKSSAAETGCMFPAEKINAFVESSKLPDEKTNHFVYAEQLADEIASAKENALKPVLNLIETSEDEKSVTAGLYLLNRLIDSGTKGIEDAYHLISKFNYTDSSNIKVMLSGVYRKTQIPDAFGPLMTMYMKDWQDTKNRPFDAKEEVGGAILSYLNNKELAQNLIEYLRNQASVNNYSNKLN